MKITNNFKIGDFVRLGNDMPFLIMTKEGVANVNSKPYRYATDEEKVLACMKILRRLDSDMVSLDEINSEWKRLSVVKLTNPNDFI